MSCDHAIKFSNVSKAFKLYKKPLDVFKDFAGMGSGLEEFEALNNISFSVKKGDIVGLIGRNGAGKSTLLKIIAGVLPQSEGEVLVNGKVSAILELGTGFHPEYTGRENVVMGGMCLGLSKTEVLSKMQSIIDFSELAQYMDRPFKTYSSGMKARLTFATAISVVPEILIIDEALSVGDALFAEKCFEKIREIARQGTTIFFVSHSISHIFELCNSALLLHKGELLLSGSPREIGAKYELLLQNERAGGEGLHMLSSKDENKEASVTNIYVKDLSGAFVNQMINGQRYTVGVVLESYQDLKDINVSFRLRKVTGQTIYGNSLEYMSKSIDLVKGSKVTVNFEFECRLNNSQVILAGGITQSKGKSFRLIDRSTDAGICTVVSDSIFQGEFDLRSTAQVTFNQ